MQNAKDTFYITLRDRIAALNPARTAVIRGITRPGVLVEENELASATEPADVFRLRWTGTKVDLNGALPLITMSCEIRYGTDGNAGNGGMDRDRLLAGMDAELAAAVGAAPQNAAKLNYAALGAATAQGVGPGTAPAPMATNIFWGDAVFSNVAINGERLERVATVVVFSYQEAGEL